LDFFTQFHAPPWSIVVEDDDRTCYAYLLRSGEVVGDVWLCNRVPPADPEWQRPDGKDQMPFLNPLPYVDGDAAGVYALDPDELTVDWTVADDDRAVAALLERDRPFAVLSSADKPGRCRLAVRPGPLALPL
jgi:hypothetical protein